MQPVIVVVTGLDQLAPAERWPRFIEPLSLKLSNSGLGELLECADLQREFTLNGTIKITQIGIRLSHFDYGTELVDNCVRLAGVVRNPAVTPDRWHAYGCDDYFRSEYAAKGYFDNSAQYWYICPFDRIIEIETLDFLVLGGPGVDGIQWGYRRSTPGFWAYPIDGNYVQLASDLGSFMRSWLGGSITI